MASPRLTACAVAGMLLAPHIAFGQSTLPPPPVVERNPRDPFNRRSEDDEWLETLVQEEEAKKKARAAGKPDPDAAPRAAPGAKAVIVRPEDPDEGLQRAARGPEFGAPGSFAVTDDANLFVGARSYANSDAEAFGVGIWPGLDYFVTKNVSLGVTAGGAYGITRGYAFSGALEETQSSSVSGGLRVGTNVRLGRFFSLYPRLTLGFEWTRVERSVVDAVPAIEASTDYVGPWLGVSLPLLFHPRPHFFLGLGPALFHGFAPAEPEVGGGGQRTRFGASLLVGVHWGGAPEPARERVSSSSREENRFGRRGQIVVSSEATLAASWLSYQGRDVSSSGYAIAPAFDYFFADRFSAGVQVFFSGSESRGSELSTGSSVVATRQSVGLRLALGADLPLAEWLSFYPKISIGFESGPTELRSLGETATLDASAFSVRMYAPLLVHVASNAFLGFGPDLSHDLARTVSSGQSETDNVGTSIGAGMIVGGYLD